MTIQRATTLRGLMSSSAATFGLSVTSAGLAFVTTLALTRSSLPADYGTYAAIVAVGSVIAVIAMAGFDQLVIREVAAGIAHERWSYVRGILARSRDVTMLLSALLIAAAAALGLMGVFSFPFLAFAMGLACIPIQVLARLRQSTLLGLHRVIPAQLPENLVRNGFLASVALIAGVVLTQITDVQMMTMALVATFLGYLVGTVLLHKELPPQVIAAPPEFHTSAWLRQAAPLLAITGATRLTVSTPVVLLTILMAPDQVGLYAVAFQVAALIHMVGYSVGAVAGPNIARLWSLNEMDQLQRLTIWSTRLATIGALPLVGACVVFGDAILNIFGDHYAQAAPALAILAIGALADAAAGPVLTLLNMTGQQLRAAYVQLTVAVISIPVSFGLIALWGVNGAATSQTLTLIASNIAWLWMVRHHVHISPSVIGRSGSARVDSLGSGPTR